jgi:hypothetical protein
MSGITGISGYNASLLPLLSEAESGLSDPSLLNSVIAGGIQAASPDSGASSATGTGSSSDLQDQIQSAVTAALQSAEESGNPDLKDVVYNTLVQVLQKNGIDPKTLQPTSSTGQSGDSAGTSGSVSSTTSAILSEVLAALSGASAASNPAAQLASSQEASQGSSDLASLLSTSQNSTPSGDSLSQFLALENDSQGSTDLSSLLSASGTTSQTSSDLLSSLLPSQNNNQNLLGFLYDSGQ